MLIVDTAPIVAAADTADPAYERCRTLLESHPGPLVTTALVIAEAGWLIRRQLDLAAEALLYIAIAQEQISVAELTTGDWTRIAELIDTYADIGLDAADASIIAIAERFKQPPSRPSTNATSESCGLPTSTVSNSSRGPPKPELKRACCMNWLSHHPICGHGSAQGQVIRDSIPETSTRQVTTLSGPTRPSVRIDS